ncbi:MAG TPA: ATP-binding protein [Myxococcota bacterium]|nr:ATP-binding protein [Myxococcota bacterium]HRY96346.1 ATP-binding protein [Myxococcota bacterium]HSA23575.1 ATP-binding protein [Myxococcota bacterium]
MRPALRTCAARSLAPARAAALRELAVAHLAGRNPQAAEGVLRQALALDAASPEARLALARGLYHLGDFQGALAWLAPLRELVPAALLEGRVHADRRAYPEAVEAFSRTLARSPGQPEALLRRASALLAAGEPLRALEDLDRLLAAQPDQEIARLLRAAARLEAGLPGPALEDLGCLPADREGPAWLLLRVQALAQSGAPEEEVERTLAQGVARQPGDAGLRLALARRLASRASSDPAALARARELLEPLAGAVADPPPPDALRAQAQFLLAGLAGGLDEGPEGAEAHFQQGLALAPDDAEGLTGLGWLLLEHGRVPRALPWLVRAALLAPERPRTLEALARALAAVPDDEAAARWLGLLVAGLPQRAPRLLAQLLRQVQEAGRDEANRDVEREAHRMKNRIAVLAARTAPTRSAVGAARAGPADGAAPEAGADDLGARLQQLFDEWVRFLETIRDRPRAPSLLSPARLVRLALERVGAPPGRVEVNLPARLPLLRGDETQLGDALANVLGNALEASPPDRPVRLAVRCPEGDAWIELVVTDQGPGVPPGERQHIFESGYTSKENGTGLGLAIARRAVQAHGGRLGLASAPGGPTTFSLRLPAAQPPAPEPGLPFGQLALERLEAELRRAPGEPGGAMS